MKTFQQFISEGRYTPVQLLKIVQSVAKEHFGSNLYSVEDSMGIGDIEVTLDKADKKSMPLFKAKLKKNGVDHTHGFEVHPSGETVFVRHPDVA